MNKNLRAMLLALLFSALPFTSTFAQGYYVLSNQTGADSSLYHFNEGDTLYMNVFAPNLNVNNMMKMKWMIKRSHMSDFEGQFTNKFNGYFEATFVLDGLPETGEWDWEAKLKDHNGNEAEYEAQFTYQYRPAGDGKEFELKGYINSIGADSLIVDGYVFRTDSNTVVSDMRHNTFSYSDLQIGDYVEVEAYELEDGSYLASRIKLEDKNTHHDEYDMEYSGTIDSVGIDFIDVNGLRFFVNDQTEIKGDNHSYMSLSDLTPGLFVKIESRKQADDTLWAKEIKIMNQCCNADEHQMEFKGIIDSLGVDYVIVNGVTFYTNAQTVVMFGNHRKGSLNELTQGMSVEIKAAIQADSSYLARKIEIEEEYMNSIHFTGIIDSVANNAIIVFGYMIYIDETSEIKGHRNSTLAFSDLEKGQRVKVKGYLQDDGSVFASQIKIKSFYEYSVEFEGYVDSLGTDWIQVNQVTFMVDDATIILDINRLPVTLSQINIADFVEIKAIRLDDGSWLAKRIKLEDEKIGRIELSASIDSIGTDFLMLGGITIFIDDSTTIHDYTGATLLLSDLSAGQYVEVKAYIQSDGTYLAVRIKLEDSPGMSVYSATLNGFSGNLLIVGGQEIRINASTIILNETYQPVDLSVYSAGDEVTVWAQQDDVSSDAVQVKLGAALSVTSVGNSALAELPSGFDLQQNYPNPFNPATTIPLYIQGKQFQQVRLDVYNILGQRVKTLFNGVLGAGKYTFRWNATNDFGQNVSSGMYFYKLNIAGKSSVKQMLLVR